MSTEPKLKADSDGATAVIGAKPYLSKYANAPWADVVAAAERGADGLRLASIGTDNFEVASGEFALREIHTVTWGKRTGLYQQNW